MLLESSGLSIQNVFNLLSYADQKTYMTSKNISYRDTIRIYEKNNIIYICKRNFNFAIPTKYTQMFYYLHDTIKQYKICAQSLHNHSINDDRIDYIDINIYKIRTDNKLNYTLS